MAQLRPIDLRLLGTLGARGGRARPGELREWVGLPARSITRALGRLDDAGMLSERSKAQVTLSAAAWLLLTPSEATRAAVYQARPLGSEPALDGDEPALEHEDLDDVDELDEDYDGQPLEHEELDVDEQLEEQATDEGGFMRGFVEGL